MASSVCPPFSFDTGYAGHESGSAFPINFL